MKVFFDTLGCAKNFDDTEIARGVLRENGHEVVKDPEDADVLVVNTCGFIDDAKRESIDEVFKMSEYRSQGKKLIMSGCMAQRYYMTLTKEMPEVDAFVGVNDYEKLPEVLNDLDNGEGERNEQGQVVRVDGVYTDRFEEDESHKALPENPYTANLRIAEGCDQGCTYCIIPKIRGRYRSRTMESILDEAERLADAGCKELVVIAQDTSCYGKDIYGRNALSDLLRKLVKIEGIEWIRIMYCYEDHMDEELMDVMASEPKIVHYIDIPLQHAADRILKRMNRHTTKAEIIEKLSALREKMPDIHIRTTIIVGFPGETEEDFEELLDFVEEQKFARLGAFTYSQEEGTPAANMPDQIDEDIKQDRLDRLMELQMRISNELNTSKIGQTFDVMVDGPDEEEGVYLGRTKYDAPDIDDAVIFTAKGDHEPGEMVKVLIQDAFDYDLSGVEV
ncbi:MAG: 30S ribosomal protein S12 methylthiotransferase RimO [Eubacteriales bacterium]|nr:30S ribosomal protein S12 methylthiotransferase RimO [Eubacteriales bacterium]